MSLTYGMIGDRLSDLVADLNELNGEPSRDQRDKHYIIEQLENLRAHVDYLSVNIIERSH